MRTTLDLDDELMRAVKRRAADTGRTLTSLIESALRDLLRREADAPGSYRLEWPVVEGRALPGVDITDRDALYDRMDERE